jgi:penicillin-binding protein 1A
VNTITVQLYKALGPKNVENWVKSLGLKHFNGDNMSACLGTDENTPMNLLLAYTNMLRNNNTAINAVTKIVDNRNNRVLYQTNNNDKNNTTIGSVVNTAKSLFSTKRDDKTKRNLFDETLTKRMTAMMLKTSLTGTAKAVRLNGFKSDFACKTGTTQNSQNSWLIGVSPNVSIVVWCGIKPSSINNNIIVGGALPSLIASNILAYTDYIYDYDNLSFNLKINSCVDKIRPVMMQDTLINDTIMYNQ